MMWKVNTFVLYVYLFGLLSSYAVSVAQQDCVTGCSCKWRGGKRTVECPERGLIMIPEGIDPDTLVLDMSGNNLQILPRETFQRAGLVNLQKLYLRSCRLGQIDDNAFRGLTNLVELDLSNNLLTFVPSHTFMDIPYLRNISLSRNPIQKIDPFAFRPVSNLVKLDVSYCNIQSIGPKAFEGLDNLETLRLNDNQLSELPPNTVNLLHRLRTIELQGNNWRCDCNLRATRIWLSKDSVHVPTPVFCSGGPNRLKDQPFLELSAEDLACKPQIKTDTRYVEAIAGTNATIECRVESDPVARITWYWNGKSLNNYSVFTPNQRIFITQTGENIYDMRSKLILTTVEASDGGQFYCIAENRAGNDEANFTLKVLEANTGIVAIGSSNIGIIVLAFAILILVMLAIIFALFRKIRRASYPSEKSGCKDESNVGTIHRGAKSNSSDTSSTTEQSHDSVYKDAGKAFTITSDLSYSRSLSDIGNPAFSNPDLINSANININHSACGTPLPITRPISDYCQNWPASYGIQRTTSSSGFSYDTNCDRMPMIIDTMSAGSGSDEVFARSRISNDYPPDYGLPILPENGVNVNQPCAKTLKVWQKGVPVYPPMCNSATVMQHPSARNSPADIRSQGCGTDV